MVARGFLIAVLLSFGPTVSNSFARFAYALVLPAMRADLHLNYSEAGWLNTANAFGYLAGAMLTWTLVRATGNRALFAAGMVATSATLLATGLTHDLAWLTAMRIAAGVGGAMVFITGGALAGNIFPDRPELATTTVLLYFGGAGFGREQPTADCGADHEHDGCADRRRERRDRPPGSPPCNPRSVRHEAIHRREPRRERLERVVIAVRHRSSSGCARRTSRARATSDRTPDSEMPMIRAMSASVRSRW